MSIQNQALHRIIQGLMDIAAIILAWWLTIYLRVSLNVFALHRVSRSESSTWVPDIAPALAFWIILMLWSGQYGNHSVVRLRTLLSQSLTATALLFTISSMVVFFSRSLGADLSRSFAVVLIPVVFSLFCVSRWLSAWVTVAVQRVWPGEGKVAVCGDRDAADEIIRTIKRTGTAFCGVIVPEGTAEHNDRTSVPVLGTTRNIAEVINRERLDRIILVNGAVPGGELLACSQVSRRMGVAVSYAMAPSVSSGRMDVSTRYGLSLVEDHPTEFTRIHELLKRIVDIIIAGLITILLLPIFVIIMAAVKLSSRGPVFYAAPRVGKGGKYFTFYKFRSMYTDTALANRTTHRDGHLYKRRDDPRITPIGAFLRRYSLDELPQLFNVLAGDMSLVGPRPLPAEDLDLDGMSRHYYVWSEVRSRVRPGITGIWQISGRSDLPFERMIELDTDYINNWSLALDVHILCKTPFCVLNGRGAY